MARRAAKGVWAEPRTGRDAVVATHGVLVVSVLTGLGGFGLLMALAMASYAGGNFVEVQASGYSFWNNFWCDLLRARSVGGSPNDGAAHLATAGMLVFSASLPAFWLLVSKGLRSAALGRALSVGGTLSALAIALVVSLPSDRYPVLHAPAVLLAGGLGVACVVVSICCDPGARVRLLGVLLVALATYNSFLYVDAAYFGAPMQPLLPTLQKLTTIVLVAWMIAQVRAVLLKLQVESQSR